MRSGLILFGISGLFSVMSVDLQNNTHSPQEPGASSSAPPIRGSSFRKTVPGGFQLKFTGDYVHFAKIPKPPNEQQTASVSTNDSMHTATAETYPLVSPQMELPSRALTQSANTGLHRIQSIASSLSLNRIQSMSSGPITPWLQRTRSKTRSRADSCSPDTVESTDNLPTILRALEPVSSRAINFHSFGTEQRLEMIHNLDQQIEERQKVVRIMESEIAELQGLKVVYQLQETMSKLKDEQREDVEQELIEE